MNNKKCGYIEPWKGACENDATDENGRCGHHRAERCTVCKKSTAVKGCPNTRQLVCGMPLCEACNCFCDENRRECDGNT